MSNEMVPDCCRRRESNRWTDSFATPLQVMLGLREASGGKRSMSRDRVARPCESGRRAVSTGLSLAIFGVLTVGLLAVRVPAKDAVVWIESYDEAIEEARSTGKPIFLEYRCAP